LNVFLGAYGSEGGVNMEVDYIRAYNWPLKDGNELPNPDFEGKAGLAPWEGAAVIEEGRGEKGSKAVVLAPGQKIEQYVYLNPQQDFKLGYWSKGGKVQAEVDDVAVVTGRLSTLKTLIADSGKRGGKQAVDFVTGKEINPNKKIVRIGFINIGTEKALLDNITLKKR